MLLRPHRSLRCATESCFSIRGNRENEFASFQALRHGNLAISSQQSRQKTTLAQWVRNSSRATGYLQLQQPTPSAFRTRILNELTQSKGAEALMDIYRDHFGVRHNAVSL